MVLQKKEWKSIKKGKQKIHMNISEAGASDSSSLSPLRIVKLNQTQTQQQSG